MNLRALLKHRNELFCRIVLGSKLSLGSYCNSAEETKDRNNCVLQKCMLENIEYYFRPCSLLGLY